jgi:hypothetical protein
MADPRAPAPPTWSCPARRLPGRAPRAAPGRVHPWPRRPRPRARPRSRAPSARVTLSCARDV